MKLSTLNSPLSTLLTCLLLAGAVLNAGAQGGSMNSGPWNPALTPAQLAAAGVVTNGSYAFYTYTTNYVFNTNVAYAGGSPTPALSDHNYFWNAAVIWTNSDAATVVGAYTNSDGYLAAKDPSLNWFVSDTAYPDPSGFSNIYFSSATGGALGNTTVFDAVVGSGTFTLTNAVTSFTITTNLASSNVYSSPLFYYNTVKKSGYFFSAGNYTNLDGGQNTAGGYQAMRTGLGEQNTAFGYQCLQNTTAAANNNSAFGWGCLFSVVDAYENAALGDDALNQLITGYGNAAFGGYSLYALTNGSFNAAIGQRAGVHLISGTNNFFVGYESGPQSNFTTNNTGYVGNPNTEKVIVYGKINASAESVFTNSAPFSTPATTIVVGTKWTNTFNARAALDLYVVGTDAVGGVVAYNLQRGTTAGTSTTNVNVSLNMFAGVTAAVFAQTNLMPIQCVGTNEWILLTDQSSGGATFTVLTNQLHLQ